ncbi:fibronectin type III domain-containing protein, partial [Microbacterium allomyrinae]
PVTGLTTGSEYWFKVRAVNANGASAYTASVFATPVGTTPTATPTPTNPTNVPGLPGGVTAASASSTSVAVSWTAVSGATKYEIAYRPTVAGSVKYVTTTATTQPVTGLTTGSEYWFKVRAVNANGASAYTASVFATPVGTTPTATPTPTTTPT